ncbi:hypothetical protein [Reichenbachiella ulvae]|uniref:Uncharacterized protein n=1 Tax=Reichenbachiella ulvae TaxID=2980104 RepID=A0ABT3CTH6_9BACT|nr:hypothetical protein [Reichenbachiella ulvae]MCV9386902.1 hypothetical protein [Reichenbachiella ulvae]
MRKTITQFAIGILAIFTFSCDDIDKLTQFRMNYTESVTIESSTVIGIPIDLSTPSIPSNSESTFAGNNTSKDLIEEISLESMTLTITSPQDGEFSFLESALLLISADGLDEVEIAYIESIPDDIGNSIDMEVTGVNVKDYLLKDQFSLRMKSSTDKTISQDHTIDIKSTFFVDAKIFGQ